MILYPAIDLKDGACVRLLRGAMDQATVFNTSPAQQARSFREAGCQWLHVVDLDGAFAGKPANTHAVKEILEALGTDVPVQLGGGIRSIETIDLWLSQGISRVILGTVALRNPALVKEACQLFPNQVAVGIDARDGFVAVEGWAETSSTTALDLAHQFEDAGVCAIIYTDISRDGAMQGPNIEATAALAREISIPVIVSGGVSSLDDLRAIRRQQSSGIAGVIAGRALYDGAFTLAAALEILSC